MNELQKNGYTQIGAKVRQRGTANYVMLFLFWPLYFIVGPRCSLWVADDHLLLVVGKGYHEEYRRFMFSDIQAFIIQKTPTQYFMIAVWSIFTAFNVLIMFAGEPGLILGTPFALLFFVCLLVELYRGRTVKTYVRTAVKLEELPPLNRLKWALDAIPQLEQKVAQSQGELSPELVQQAPNLLFQKSANPQFQMPNFGTASSSPAQPVQPAQPTVNDPFYAPPNQGV